MRATTTLFVGTAACLATSSALASPIDDFRASSEIYLEAAKVVVRDDSFFEGGQSAAKTPGTLDLVVDGAALSLGTSALIPLTATVLDDARIRYTFDTSFASPISVGTDVTVKRVRGELVVRVDGLHGSRATACLSGACTHSVSLTSESASLTISGKGRLWKSPITKDFEETITDLTLLAWSGLPRPQLASAVVTIPADGPCPVSATRTYWGEARLATPAPAHGARVDVTGADPGVLTSTSYMVAPGESSVAFPLRFGPADGGMYALRIASGGVEVVRNITVKPCLTDVHTVGYRVAHRPEIDGLCKPCMDDARLTDRLTLVRHGGTWLDVRPEGAFSLDDRVGGMVLDVRADDFGHVYGAAWMGDATRSFRIDGGTGQLTGGPELWPVGTVPGALVGVTWSQASQTPVFYALREGAATPIPMPMQAWQVVGVTPSQHIVAVGWDPNLGVSTTWLVRADGSASPIGSLGGNVIATAISASGDIVGWADDPNGGRRAFVKREGAPMLELLPLPELGPNGGQYGAPWGQYQNQQASWQPTVPDSTAVGIADDGLGLGRMLSPTGEPMPFLARIGSPEAHELAALVDDLEGYVLGEPMAITPAGRIAVRATRQGEPTILFLEPRLASTTMKTSLFKPVLALVLLAGLSACSGSGCTHDDASVPGAADGMLGGKCVGSEWVPPGRTCTEAFTTCTRGVCRSCGGPGEPICPVHHSGDQACKPGSVAESGKGKCSATCGKSGGACCSSVLPALPYCASSGDTCNTSSFTCVPSTGGAGCEPGTHGYEATCVAATGCAARAFMGLVTSSGDTADACIKSTFHCSAVNHDAIHHFPFCKTFMGKSTPFSVDATDATKLACASHEAGEGATVTEGDCPK